MKRLTPEVQTMLEQKIIPFWLSLKDERYGGFISYVDLDLRRYAKAEKGCILNSRILWFFSEAAMLLHTPELSHAADHAYRFLMRYCVDRKAGGVFWSVTYDGKSASRLRAKPSGGLCAVLPYFLPSLRSSSFAASWD